MKPRKPAPPTAVLTFVWTTKLGVQVVMMPLPIGARR